MSSRKEELRKWANEYIASTGKTVYRSRDIAEWAIKKGYWIIPNEKQISLCADEFARSFK